jgi:hypothetical protein
MIKIMTSGPYKATRETLAKMKIPEWHLVMPRRSDSRAAEDTEAGNTKHRQQLMIPGI